MSFKTHLKNTIKAWVKRGMDRETILTKLSEHIHILSNEELEKLLAGAK